MKFIARRANNARNGNFISLRVIYPTSRLPGDGSSEFGRLRWERGGWNTWASDEDFDNELRAAVVRAGRNADLPVVLAACRAAYMARYHEEETTEADYEAFVASHGDASGPGQDWDCNGGRYL